MSQFEYETLDPSNTGELISTFKSIVKGVPNNRFSHMELSWALAYLASEIALEVEPASRALCIGELVIDALKSSINDQGKKRRPDDQISFWPARSTAAGLFPLVAVK
jgi:hypothetical protein